MRSDEVGAGGSDLIALLTDFGDHDWFVGVMKGVILSVNPHARIVDVTHAVPRHDVRAGSFALRASYRYFPSNAVFAVVVDPGVGGPRRIICAKSASRVFVAPDNGVLTSVLSEEDRPGVVTVENQEFFLKPVSSTFHGRDIFAPVAAHLSLGMDPARLGRTCADYQRIEIAMPEVGVNEITGCVEWIDTFGNLVTNIPAATVEILRKDWGEAWMVGADDALLAVVDAYSACGAGDLMGIVGSSGYLEVSVGEGSAARMLSLGIGDTLRLRKP